VKVEINEAFIEDLKQALYALDRYNVTLGEYMDATPLCAREHNNRVTEEILANCRAQDNISKLIRQAEE
jgi:hypothetical protein